MHNVTFYNFLFSCRNFQLAYYYDLFRPELGTDIISDSNFTRVYYVSWKDLHELARCSRPHGHDFGGTSASSLTARTYRILNIITYARVYRWSRDGTAKLKYHKRNSFKTKKRKIQTTDPQWKPRIWRARRGQTRTPTRRGADLSDD